MSRPKHAAKPTRGTHRAPSTTRQHRAPRPLLLSVGVAAVLLTGMAISDRQPQAVEGQVRRPLGPSSPVQPPSPTPDQLPAQPIATGPTLTPATNAPQAVSVPESGGGLFDIARRTSPQVGDGPLTSYTVEVETDLPLAAGMVAKVVDEALGDPRSWTANGEHSLQRTDGDSDIRVLITTPETTDRLCAPLDTGGRLSCRMGERVVLNAWRWVNGAEAYGSDLRSYRRYLVNHEVGHALGNPHESCPEPGALAPVMMQQTKGIDSCVPNPWPYPM